MNAMSNKTHVRLEENLEPKLATLPEIEVNFTNVIKLFCYQFPFSDKCYNTDLPESYYTE